MSYAGSWSLAVAFPDEGASDVHGVSVVIALVPHPGELLPELRGQEDVAVVARDSSLGQVF